MDNRARIPTGLPRSDPTESYWQDPPASISTIRTTPVLPAATSVIIVGSGITGAFLAYNILNQPCPPSVLMLEARTASSGATSRNGGHTKHASYRSFLDNLQLHGEDEAARIVRFEYDCMIGVHAFAREHGIECDSWEGDTVDIFYDEGQQIKAKKATAEMQRILGTDEPASRYKFWNKRETEEEFMTNGACGAVSYRAGSLSAYKLVIGVLKLALEKGLNLQTETPALRLREHKKDNVRWIVQTPRGDIQAEKVLLATNGYTAYLYPALQGVIVPWRGHMTAQRPGSCISQADHPGSYSFIYEKGFDYMIFRPPGTKFAGDVLLGGGMTKAIREGLYELGTTDDTVTDPVIIDYLRACSCEYFGSNWGSDDREGRLRKAWTGIMGLSADNFPFVGRLPEEGLYVAASFQGSGMVLCFSSAKALVLMMENRDEELKRWFPHSFNVSKERMEQRFNKE